MRIDDLNRPPQAPATERTGQATEQAGKARDRVQSSDQVDISQLAHTLTSSDPARIEQLRLSVKSGAYRVQPDVVANSIIDEHLKP